MAVRPCLLPDNEQDERYATDYLGTPVYHKYDFVTFSKLLYASAILGLLLLLLACAELGDKAVNKEFDLSSKIDAVLRAASSDGSGFAIIVELNGETLLSNGYGYADREKQLAFTPASIAQIGSLTKQFTATAILQLAEAGTVDLGVPLRTYIPQLKPPAGDITLSQLLTHSSGLPEYCGDDFDRLDRDGFISTCLSLPLGFAPGTDVAYSNVGYAAVAAVIELVTGMDFETYVEEELLRLNGLNATGHHFRQTQDAIFARGYLADEDMGNIREKIESLDGKWWNLKGNGGMQASTLDMYDWYKTLNGGGELSQNVRAELTVPHSPWLDGVAEGYGWYFRSDDEGHIRQMSHSGSDGVFFSYYWHRPDKQAFMYFVGNSGEDASKEVLREILRIFTTVIDR